MEGAEGQPSWSEWLNDLGGCRKDGFRGINCTGHEANWLALRRRRRRGCFAGVVELEIDGGSREFREWLETEGEAVGGGMETEANKMAEPGGVDAKVGRDGKLEV
jgi:hypothetical protein